MPHGGASIMLWRRGDADGTRSSFCGWDLACYEQAFPCPQSFVFGASYANLPGERICSGFVHSFARKEATMIKRWSVMIGVALVVVLLLLAFGRDSSAFTGNQANTVQVIESDFS